MRIVKIQLRKRRAYIPAFAALAFIIFVFIIIIVLFIPEVADWIQESLRIIFGR